ncbi:hypothetical protein EYR38_009078 [Pleurotus pulmonarius]|nr:hypothetical protein EYR38_009078 [Pleurotus pulmonarius]
MSEIIELRDDPQRFEGLTLSVHEVESPPGRLDNHGKSSQATVQPTAEGSQEDRQTSKKQTTTSRVQFATLCWCLFLAGWNDGTTGPLLPRIREAYNVIAYALQTPAPPFPVFVTAYVINGVGIAMQLESWSFHYLVSLGIALSNLVTLAVIFRLKGQEGRTSLADYGGSTWDSLCLIAECLMALGHPAGEKDHKEHINFRQILSQKTVYVLAFFAFLYVGIEVTVGGWIVTFFIDVRHGGPASGYISSGFYGGLTVGRVALLWANKKIGEWHVLYLYTFFAIGLQLIIWLVPSLVGDAVAVSLLGVLLGPFYPIAMNHAGRILPRWLLTGSVGWIAGFGTAGAAVVSSMTDALSSKYGIQSLQPFQFDDYDDCPLDVGPKGSEKGAS